MAPDQPLRSIGRDVSWAFLRQPKRRRCAGSYLTAGTTLHRRSSLQKVARRCVSPFVLAANDSRVVYADTSRTALVLSDRLAPTLGDDPFPTCQRAL